jgi:Xaa-Pro dipeptidase
MIERLREKMEEEDIELLIISDSENILWASGMELSGYIFLTRDRAEAVLPRFYRYEDLSIFDDVSFGFKRSDYQELLDEKASKFSDLETGIDEENEKLQEKIGAEKTDLITEMRKVKTEKEIEKIRKACEITDNALEDLRKDLFSGLTEFEAVGKLKQFYIDREVQEAFITNEGESLVQRNSLRPHRGPESEEIKDDDLVIVDTGARFENYCADVTRTYCENPSSEQEKLFEDVKEVQEEMINMMEAGRPIADVKQLELDMFREKGYNLEENVLYYSHSIGVVAHESPTITHESEEDFREGMVVTIEPGLHVEGLGGVRLEDTVVVKENGAERLSRSPREL